MGLLYLYLYLLRLHDRQGEELYKKNKKTTTVLALLSKSSILQLGGHEHKFTIKGTTVRILKCFCSKTVMQQYL
jgi:hypothetical protein